MKRLLTLMLFGTTLLFNENAVGAERDTATVWIPGVLFSFGTTDGFIVNNGNVLSVWLGAGYDLSPSWRVSALFSTGHHHIDPAAGRPVSGTLLLGAGTLEILYIMQSNAPIAPFAGVGAGIATILDPQSRGYNGWMADIRAGVEWRPSAAFSVDGFLGWNAWTWQNGVGDNVAPFEPFHVGDVSLGISMIFHPVFHRQRL